MVRIGPMRHRVEIQQMASAGVDSFGQPLEDWETFATVWARVDDQRGREFFESRQLPAGEIVSSVRIRYREDLVRQMRVIHRGRILEIVAIEQRNWPRETELLCRDLTVPLGDGAGDG